TDSAFGGWSGGGCSGTGTCLVTLNANTTVTATFTLRTSVTLTVAIRGSAGGTAMSNPAWITCGSICSASFNTGTTVTLTATAGLAPSIGVRVMAILMNALQPPLSLAPVVLGTVIAAQHLNEIRLSIRALE